MDETNLDFDIDPRYTLERKGERSVNGYIIDSSSCLTAVLAVSMSGVKLPAYNIFKGVWGGQVWAEVQRADFPQGNTRQTMQHSAWMDTPVYKDWVREVLRPYFNCRPGLLIQDNFSVHLTNASINSVNNIGVDLEFILAGYTAVLQLIDKGVNKPFKDYFKEHQLQLIINHQQRGQTNSSRRHSVGTSSMGQRG
jgi:hypothetical protein